MAILPSPYPRGQFMTTSATAADTPETRSRGIAALLERRPILSSIAVVIIVKVAMIAGIVLAAGPTGGVSTPAGAAAALPALSG